VFHFSKPVPEGEVPATYGIQQKSEPEAQKPSIEEETDEERSATPETEQSTVEDGEIVEPLEDRQAEATETEEKIES
jgi:hypothetical protein